MFVATIILHVANVNSSRRTLRKRAEQYGRSAPRNTRSRKFASTTGTERSAFLTESGTESKLGVLTSPVLSNFRRVRENVVCNAALNMSAARGRKNENL